MKMEIFKSSRGYLWILFGWFNTITTLAEVFVLVGEDRRTYHNTICKSIFCEWYQYEMVRNTGTEKNLLGLVRVRVRVTGTDYFPKMEYGINSGTDSF